MQQKDFQSYAYALNDSYDDHCDRYIADATTNHNFDEFRKSDSERIQCAFSRHCGMGYSFMIAIDTIAEKNSEVLVEWRLLPAHLDPVYPAFWPVQKLRKAMDFGGRHIIQRIDTGDNAVAIINQIIKDLNDDDVGAVIWCDDGEPPKGIDLPVIWCKKKEYPKFD